MEIQIFCAKRTTRVSGNLDQKKSFDKNGPYSLVGSKTATYDNITEGGMFAPLDTVFRVAESVVSTRYDLTHTLVISRTN